MGRESAISKKTQIQVPATYEDTVGSARGNIPASHQNLHQQEHVNEVLGDVTTLLSTPDSSEQLPSQERLVDSRKITTIVVWGETQVGKTSWLATALYERDSFWDLIDQGKSAVALRNTVFPHWNRLRTGMNIESTSEDKIDIDLVTTEDNQIRLRDIRGQLVHELHTQAVQERLIGDVDGFLFFVWWRSSALDRQINAIDAILPFLNGRPSALIFTKCEADLGAESEEWLGEPGWWRTDSRLQRFASTIEKFGERVWPVSAFGYCQEDGASDWPAMIMGEFGNTIPFGIGPQNVAAPLHWILKELKVR